MYNSEKNRSKRGIVVKGKYTQRIFKQIFGEIRIKNIGARVEVVNFVKGNL